MKPGRNADPRGGSSIQSVSRALDLLEALSKEELGMVELGRRVGLQPSTTHRMLATLSDRGYVSRRPSGKYGLGRRASYLGIDLCARERDIRVAARPVMQRVHLVAREMVNLTVLDGPWVVFVEQLRRPDSGSTTRGRRVPPHVSASGKALMAFARAERWQAAASLTPFTRRTITERSALSQELEHVRECGWAADVREYKDDLSCIAAPIFDHTGQVVAAMSVSGPPDRVIPELHADLGELVSRSAGEVSEALGYTGPAPWTLAA